MRLTDFRRSWIAKKITHYCLLLQVPEPQVFLTRKEYQAWKTSRRQYRGQHVGRSSFLGVCHRKSGIIVLNIRAAYSSKDLDNTIRHELLHYAKPSYNHNSKEFYDRLRWLKTGRIENGRFYS